MALSPAPYYVSQGQGLPVVMLHGMGMDHRGLMMLDSAFPQRLERIYIDLPGHGRTSALPAPGGLEEMARWVLAAVDEIVGKRPFALVGNSMGGAFARYLLSKEPERIKGMALLAPVVDPVKSHRNVAQHVVSEPNPALTEKVDQRQLIEFLQMGVNQSFESWRLYQRYIVPGTKLYDSDAGLRLNKRYWLNEVPEDRFCTYDGPALIVCGKRDQVVGFEDQRDVLLPHYPNAVYKVIDEAGHNVHVDQPEAVRKLLSDWALRVLQA